MSQLQSGAEVALARGVSLLSQGRVEDTIAHYRRLTPEQPEQAAFQNELGYVLLRTGRALARQPDCPEAHFNLAQPYDRGRGVPADPAEAERLARAWRPVER